MIKDYDLVLLLQKVCANLHLAVLIENIQFNSIQLEFISINKGIKYFTKYTFT